MDHPQGAHDDRVNALALALAALGPQIAGPLLLAAGGRRDMAGGDAPWAGLLPRETPPWEPEAELEMRRSLYHDR